MSSPISIDRTFGFYGMSIGTSLAFEGLLHTGEFEDGRKESVVNKYQRIYLNLRTLFRNAFESFGDKKNSLNADVMKTAILEDIQQIRETVSAVSPAVEIVVYLCTYKSINKVFPQAKFKNATTQDQMFFNSVELDVYTEMGKEDNEYGVRVFDCEIKGSFDTLVVTHYAADLLWRKNFPTLALLESHTGKVKGYLEWYTKIRSKSSRIPFNKPFLVIFADSAMFSPQDLKVRKVIMKTAEKYNWTPRSSLDLIHNSLRLANEPHVSEFIRKLS